MLMFKPVLIYTKSQMELFVRSVCFDKKFLVSLASEM